ncbi:homoserine O-acetyltransferase/O-succinyltransferase family protein [Lactobacillus kefiranofaciens]|uniref:homoserine O-acetyltransferase/O-succinyltransferase family protein n=1 Tax=Lactobacillus kefiranofaciens TaxID=267818 RepID=UPI0009E6AFBD|nr:homoserine O-succinyltransferase [Lactobacillus kefiranofaciens]MCJ2171446.1 homoserine O-succinyltransferase [Lactobacillus kefiranofaciens]MCP9330170.1 homoserine O-succinyltransferase [Lactobacillus kefiranofaciens]PAK99055.1 homoserine O-succinyltransferase [Lactobacillus kefiranofaciens]QNT44920.1 homoserine O-succinyltransferase [Lactobacillus kefiranofaciens]
MTKQLKIGILNLMHDKLDTQRRFASVLPNTELIFFYPRMHYLNRLVPNEVAQTSKPLNLEQINTLDGFIITGSPIDQIKFQDVTYIEEIRCLLNKLNQLKIPQLYFCWGAMVALNHFYGIQKQILSEKIFGIYPHLIIAPHPLLDRLSQGFIAPHARYAEMDKKQILQNPHLVINAVDDNGHLFMVSNPDKPEQSFIFSHIEYDQNGLKDEYQREVAAHPERNYKKPANYNMAAPLFQCRNTQQIFFTNWLKQVKQNKLVLE